ncbi:hypothetical protein [Streptomyces sp. NRRL B-24085]|uniref:hypothetical protein n=1 Tax=Streptomyces sp. NRRL B-24085 TaxID=1709476 RepID=UPI001F35B560|nr:hypothetical protein [Streptomyces sp. NRRL B-24085]
MIDDEELFAADLIGRRLLRVTTAWHHYADDEPSLLHLWLHLEGLGPVLFHTPSTGLSLRVGQPHGPYSMAEHGSVSVVDDSPDVPLSRFVGQPIRSVRDIRYEDGGADFTAGLTLQFPGGSIRLLGLDDDPVIAHDRHLGAVEARLHEDVTLARVVQTCGGCPSQWDAWTTRGQYLYLRYRHGEGTVEQHPSDDPDTWDGEESRLWTRWDDGSDGGAIELTDFLATAGLRLAPDARVCTASPIDGTS